MNITEETEMLRPLNRLASWLAGRSTKQTPQTRPARPGLRHCSCGSGSKA